MYKIAVVEDNPDNRLLIRAILEDLYEIVDYEAGPEALHDFNSNVPDLVLLDISLPEMDGTEVLKNIRKVDNLKHLPVIALTAHAMSGDREKFLSEGFNEYVMKPIIDETILINTIDNLLP
jgi:two-component system, cell cycle response regulator DivK